MTKLNFRTVRVIIGVGLLAGITKPAAAGYDAFATFTKTDNTTIAGDSTSAAYPYSVELHDFSVAATHNTVTLPNGTMLTSPDQLSPFTMQTNSGSQSTTLLLSNLYGTPFKTVELDIIDSTLNDKTVASWTLFNPYLTSFTSQSGDEAVLETYGFGAYSELKYTYTSYNASNTVRGTETIDWKILSSAGNYPTTSITGTVPDFQLLNGFGTVPVAPGQAGPVTNVLTPEPTSLAGLCTLACLLARRRSPRNAT